MITSNFKVVQIFQGLTRGHLEHNKKYGIPSGLLLDPRTKALVLNGRPGHLQFYSMHNDKQLFNVRIYMCLTLLLFILRKCKSMLLQKGIQYV